MKVQELRVGNTIKIDGIVVTVDERTIFDFNHDGRVKEGVLLTDRLLKDMGCFQHPFYVQNRLCLPKNGCLDFQLTKLKHFKGYSVWIMWEFNGHVVTNVEYLHQLQNLYFALTGQELALKF